VQVRVAGDWRRACARAQPFRPWQAACCHALPLTTVPACPSHPHTGFTGEFWRAYHAVIPPVSLLAGGGCACGWRMLTHTHTHTHTHACVRACVRHMHKHAPTHTHQTRETPRTLTNQAPGFERRKDLYLLYHYLNHANLFGGARGVLWCRGCRQTRSTMVCGHTPSVRTPTVHCHALC
jgi:hypothetical protein